MLGKGCKKNVKESEHAIFFHGNDQGFDMRQASFWLHSGQWEWPILPYCVEEVKRSNPYRFREDHCKFMILVLMLDGQMQYQCDFRQYQLSAGDLLVLPQNSCYSFSTGKAPSYYHKIVLEIKGSHLSMLCNALSISAAHCLHWDDPGELESKFRRLQLGLSDPGVEKLASLLGQSMEILADVSLRIRDHNPELRLLNQVQAYLGNDQNEKLSLQEVAEKTGTSCATLNRLFRQHLQTTPARYRMARKMEQAQYFLGNTSLSIKEIAFRLGYCNQFYFSREFSRNIGLSPSQYRRQKS